MKIIAFNGKREDTNNAKILKDGEKMMTLPRARVVRNAINSLSKTSSQANINNLLDIAANNQYGLRANSALREYLNENSPLKGTVLENNNWDAALQKAITKAINKLPKNRREAFLEQHNRVFNQPLDLSPTEKEIIKHRESILDSKPLQDVLNDKSKIKAADKAVKCLDYFVASSETPMREKAYVLSRLSHLLSDEYSINPQLKDKKFQVFSEIINDLVVQTPNKDILNTKDCSQKRHGSCAAISMARKTLVYEDKVAYVDTVLSELDDKPYMEVYDITRLSEYQNNNNASGNDPSALRAPKVKVEKAQINYDRALFENYRIIDASTLHWMKIAGTVGDGTISLEDYFAFDARHRGVMHDSRIVKISDKSYAAEHAYLRTLIKSRNLIKSYEKDQLKQKISERESINNEKSVLVSQSKSYRNITNILKDIVPDITIEQIRDVIQKTTHRVNIRLANNENALKEQLQEYFVSKLGEQYRPEIKKNITVLLPEVKNYIEQAKTLSEYNPDVEENAKLNKQLFDIAVAQREILNRQLKLDNAGGDVFFDDLKQPDYITQLKQYILKLDKLIKTQPNSKKIADLKAKYNYNDEQLSEFLKALYEDLTVNLPEEIDNKLALYKTSYKNIIKNTVKKGLDEHKEGNYSYMYAISNKLGTIPDAVKFEKQLERVYNNIESAKNNEEVNKALSEFGAHNASDILISALNNLTENITIGLETCGFDAIKAEFGDAFQGKTEPELWDLINQNNAEIEQLTFYIDEAAKMVNFPTVPELVFRGYEEKGEILSEKVLDDLKNKFDNISKTQDSYIARELSGEDVVVPRSVFRLSEQQKAALDKVKKGLPKFKRGVTREYERTNKSMKPKLDALYFELGQRKGHFWIGEEVHSGLCDNESIRVIEQMTGRPYRIEKDIDSIVEEIKSGKGSSASSTQVTYDEVSGHAQYIADVREIEVKDPKTGKVETKDVILHDNTWGKNELKNSWIDDLGVRRTDYGKNYGGPKGFVLTNELLAGSFVDNYKFDYGVDNDLDNANKAIDGPAVDMPSKEPYRYKIFDSVRMPGADPRIAQKSLKLMKYFFNINCAETTIEQLFKVLEENNYDVNVDRISNAENLLQAKVNHLAARLGKYDKVKLNPEDYDKLSDNDPLKVVIAKQIVRKRFPELDEDDKLSKIKTMKGVENYKAAILQSYKNSFSEYLVKTMSPSCKAAMIANLKNEMEDTIKELEDKHGAKATEFRKALDKTLKGVFDTDYNGQAIKLTTNLAVATGMLANMSTDWSDDEVRNLIDVVTDVSFDSMMPEGIESIKATPNGAELIKFIENKFNPVDDEDLINKFVKLINMPKSQYDKLVEGMTLADVGIKFDTPQNVIKLVQTGNSLETKRFRTETRYHYFDEVTRTSAQKGKVSPQEAKFNTLYWNLLIPVSEMEVGRYVKEWKEDAFRKYGARNALPNIKVRSDEQIVEQLKLEFINIANGIKKIKALNTIINYFTSIDKVNKIIESGDLEKAKSELNKNIEIIKKLSTKDGNLKASYDAADSISKKLSEEGTLNKNDLTSAMSVINAERAGKLGLYTLDGSKADLASTRRIFKENIDYLVEINVMPKFQERAKRLINEWIHLAVKNKPLDATNESLGKILEYMTEHFIMKNPEELLNYTVKKACEKKKYLDAQKSGTAITGKTFNEDMHNKIMSELKGYLVEAYNKSNRAELEFKLMSMAAKGNASKVRDVLNQAKIKVHMSDGSSVDLFSDMGMANIINALADPTNNNSTLLLFIEQTGLVKDLLESIYKSDPKTLQNLIREKSRSLVKSKASEEYVMNKFNKFIGANPDNQTPSRDVLLKVVDAYLEKVWNDKTQKVSKNWVDFYCNQFRAIVNQMTTPENVPLNSLLASTHHQCIIMFDQAIESEANQLNAMVAGAENRINLLNSIRIAPDSEEDKRRQAYNAKMQDVHDYGVMCGNYLNIVLNNPIIIQ